MSKENKGKENVNKTEKQVEVKEEKVKSKEKNNNNVTKIVVAAVLILIVVFGVVSVLDNSNKVKNIESVKKVLNAKYADVNCIDSKCNGIVAVKGDKLSKYIVELYNVEGKKIASYKEKYNSSSKSTRTPYQMSNEYFIMQIINNNDPRNIKYSINDKKGKEKYTTDNKLTVLNDKYIKMESNNKYSILDVKGKEIYNNVSSAETYMDGKYISFKIEDTYIVLDEKGNKVLNNYKIAREVKNANKETAYLIVKDTKNSKYYYYSVSKEKIIGEGFENFKTSNTVGELIITKQVNDSKVKYVLKSDGKQVKEDEFDISKIKEKVDSNQYFLYTVSIMKKNQKNVLVDNKNDKTFGILNLESNKFSPLYSYTKDKSYFYSTISKLNDSEDDLYVKINCSEYSCDTSKTIIYDVAHSKEIYRMEDADLSVYDYLEYDGGYSVIKYSSATKNEKYKNKYVLYKNKKELYVTSNRIALIDKSVKIGNEGTSSLALYSTKDKKVLNEDGAASIIKSSNKKFYKYKDSNENLIVCNEKGKNVIVTKSENIKYTGAYMTYFEDDKIYIYDIDKNKTRKYKLKNNEKMNDSTGSIISSYRGATFINNSNDKYIKVLDSKANVIKKINNVEISTVEMNSKTGNVYIITKGTDKTGNTYGLYIAK